MDSIRKITREANRKTYTYYEARYTAGFDSGTHIAPCKMAVEEWLDIWATEHLNKPERCGTTILIWCSRMR